MSLRTDSPGSSMAAFGGGTLMGTTASIKKGDIVFDRYELVKLLGVGGMGVVWLATDTKLDQLVALKFVPEALRHDPDAINDLKTQTKLGYKLTHNNIVRVLGFESDANFAAIAMEYIDGATLAAMRVDQPAQVFEADSLHVYVLHILDALEYAHEQEGIVHRDLKPANVMVNSENRVKVADFGIACSLRNSSSRVLTMPQRSGSGTLNYMSPQQLLGGIPSVSDDIYSLGATIFELMTGTPPFHSGDVPMQIREIPAPSMTQRRHENAIRAEMIPEAWETVIAAALSKEPSLRPSSVAEFRKGLMGQPFQRGTGSGKISPGVPVAHHAPSHVRPSAYVAPSPIPHPPIPKPRPAWLMPTLIGGGVAAVLVALGIVFFGPKKPDEKAPDTWAKTYLTLKNQVSRATDFEKTEASSSSKLAKWDELAEQLREQDEFAHPEVGELIRRVESRSNALKEQAKSERTEYLARVQTLRTSIDSLKKECENKELGAGAKTGLWNELLSKNLVPMILASQDKWKDHEPLIDEAKNEVARWTGRQAKETPNFQPEESTIFMMSPVAAWSDASKKKVLSDVQKLLSQKGHQTGVTDGTWGPGTFNAIVEWQKEESLPATGVLDYLTLSKFGINIGKEPSGTSKNVAASGTSSSPKRSSSNDSSGSSGGSSRQGNTWEDIAKQKALNEGGPSFGPPGGGFGPPGFN